MRSRQSFFSSSVGAKTLVALSGLALAGFLVGHLAGNLLVVVGPATFNRYADRLVTNPLLVPAEIGLGVIFLLHAYKTVRLALDNRRARPVPYAARRWAGHTSRKSAASSSMIVSGAVIFVFLLLHLKTFKYGPHYVTPDGTMRDLGRLVFEVFSRPAYVAFYVVCMGLVGLHLMHGVSSAFQSLGSVALVPERRLRVLSRVVALVIGGGFALIPLYVYLTPR